MDGFGDAQTIYTLRRDIDEYAISFEEFIMLDGHA
jgi:hypothetical protein